MEYLISDFEQKTLENDTKDTKSLEEKAQEILSKIVISAPKGSKVVVAMSGGVDSSVTAAVLKYFGYEVIGVSLRLHDYAKKEETQFGRCCSISDFQDARGVAYKMGIPFFIRDLEEEFEKEVIDHFVEEYLAGRTPNPCIKCNEKVKFHSLMEWAMDLGADYLATGHYARIQCDSVSQSWSLLKAVDPNKDQSYFLFTLKETELAKTLFPLGELQKPEVRTLALFFGLNVAQKPDSQEICFVQSKSYQGFLAEKLPNRKATTGNIIDEEGKILGTHSGVENFTIGQRKGIGIFAEKPLFVLGINADRQEVVVGGEEKLYLHSTIVSRLNWIDRRWNGPNQGEISAKIRYRAKESPVRIQKKDEKTWFVEFETAQRAITPGQAIVFYQRDKVLGGGWIEKTQSSNSLNNLNMEENVTTRGITR